MSSPFSFYNEDNNTLTININSKIKNQVSNLNNVSPLSGMSNNSHNKSCIICFQYKTNVYKICDICHNNYLCQDCITSLTINEKFNCSLCRSKLNYKKVYNYYQNKLNFSKFIIYPILYFSYLVMNIWMICDSYKKGADEYEFTKSINSIFYLKNFLIIVLFTDCILYFVNVILFMFLTSIIYSNHRQFSLMSALSINSELTSYFKYVYLFINITGLILYKLLLDFKDQISFYFGFYVFKILCFMLCMFLVIYYNLLIFAYNELKKSYSYKIIYKIHHNFQNMLSI